MGTNLNNNTDNWNYIVISSGIFSTFKQKEKTDTVTIQNLKIDTVTSYNGSNRYVTQLHATCYWSPLPVGWQSTVKFGEF